MSVKVLLIGIDGATFSVLDPLIADGVMPFLRSFLAQGARADLGTIVPPLTPPAWTSLMTGHSPGCHGIFDFFRMESSQSRHIRLVNSHDVGCETFWSVASRNGLRVTALNFPLMFPPPKISGYVVPGWVPWRQLRLACTPENLFDRLKALPGFNPRELAMDMKLEEKTTEGCSDKEYGAWIEFHIRREQNWGEICRYLMQEEACELSAVLFDGVDKLQHLCWRFIDTEAELRSEWERRVRSLCLEYFRHLDHLIEQICNLAGPQATTLIASDHGFGPTQEVFHVNSWLEQQGYLAWSETAMAREENDGAVLGVGRVARHTYLLDWNRTTAFVATPTSNGIYIMADGDGKSPGVSASRYESFRQELIQQLGQLRSPATGKPVVERIWTREEAFPGPYISMAPDLTLSLKDGGLVSILPADRPLTQRPHVAGAHRPIGIFAARGPGIRRGVQASPLSILDVMPLLLYSLGLPVPADLDGRMPEQVLEPTSLGKQRVRSEALSQAETAVQTQVETVLDAESEAEIMRRLQDLGYVD